jgi:hypothetical protein
MNMYVVKKKKKKNNNNNNKQYKWLWVQISTAQNTHPTLMQDVGFSRGVLGCSPLYLQKTLVLFLSGSVPAFLLIKFGRVTSNECST